MEMICRHHCHASKAIGEFVFCHTCSYSACNNCFFKFHRQPNAAGAKGGNANATASNRNIKDAGVFHDATAWQTLQETAVQFALEGLQQLSAGVKLDADNATESIDKFLLSLKGKLCDIVTKSREAALAEIENQVESITAKFNVDGAAATADGAKVAGGKENAAPPKRQPSGGEKKGEKKSVAECNAQDRVGLVSEVRAIAGIRREQPIKVDVEVVASVEAKVADLINELEERLFILDENRRQQKEPLNLQFVSMKKITTSYGGGDPPASFAYFDCGKCEKNCACKSSCACPRVCKCKYTWQTADYVKGMQQCSRCRSWAEPKTKHALSKFTEIETCVRRHFKPSAKAAARKHFPKPVVQTLERLFDLEPAEVAAQQPKPSGDVLRAHQWFVERWHSMTARWLSERGIAPLSRHSSKQQISPAMQSVGTGSSTPSSIFQFEQHVAGPIMHHHVLPQHQVRFHVGGSHYSSSSDHEIYSDQQLESYNSVNVSDSEMEVTMTRDNSNSALQAMDSNGNNQQASARILSPRTELKMKVQAACTNLGKAQKGNATPNNSNSMMAQVQQHQPAFRGFQPPPHLPISQQLLPQAGAPFMYAPHPQHGMLSPYLQMTAAIAASQQAQAAANAAMLQQAYVPMPSPHQPIFFAAAPTSFASAGAAGFRPPQAQQQMAQPPMISPDAPEGSATTALQAQQHVLEFPQQQIQAMLGAPYYISAQPLHQLPLGRPEFNDMYSYVAS